MKPDWKDAPEWANYLAMDIDGEWYWYESKPKPLDFEEPQWWCGKGRMTFAGGGIGWRDTLEQRP